MTVSLWLSSNPIYTEITAARRLSSNPINIGITANYSTSLRKKGRTTVRPLEKKLRTTVRPLKRKQDDSE